MSTRSVTITKASRLIFSRDVQDFFRLNSQVLGSRETVFPLG